MEEAKQFQIQDFLLSITSQNSILHLEAKERSSGKIFTVSIDNDAIAQITNGLFDSAESLTQGLKDASSGSYPELKITIDSQGTLFYTMAFRVGTRKREDSFHINLIEKEANPLQNPNNAMDKWKEKYETKVNSLEENFQVFQGKNEERFNKLEDMILQMEQKMNQRFDVLEKLCEVRNGQLANPQKEESRKTVGYFNDVSFNKSSYDFSSDRTTIVLKAKSSACLEVVPQIPQTGQHSYSFKINKKTSPMVFGIATERKKQNWSSDAGSYTFATDNGKIIGNSPKQPGVNHFLSQVMTIRKPDVSGPFGQDHIVKMVVDMDNGILTVFVDEKRVNSCEISTSESYFVYASLGGNGDSLTLI